MEVYKARKLVYLCWLLGGIMLFGFSVFCIDNGLYITGGGSFFFATIATLGCIYVLIKGRSVAIDDQGILISDYSKEKVLWSDIARIDFEFLGVGYVFIDLEFPEKYPSDRPLPPRMREVYGNHHINLGLGGMGHVKEEMANRIKALYGQAIREGS